ncbi:DNA-directed RNA polymerase sigma-70 factor [Prolixibacter sp. SD074]|nr:DNA-directed RNA polymerase sigma-70 factor [Prolixibacter sp. SD074]
MVWNNFREGDRRAFETIYNEFSDSLYAYGSKITSDCEMLKDCIQDVFIDIYKYGTELRNPASLEFYLFKTLKRNIFRKLKEQSGIKLADIQSNSFYLKFELEERNEQEEMLDEGLLKLQAHLKSLNPVQRELLYLKFNSGLSYVEIGRILGIKPDTVKKQVYRLLDGLRSQLSKNPLELLFIYFAE